MKSRFRYIFLSLVSVAVYSAAIMPSVAHAQSASDLKAKIDARNADIERLEQEIAVYQKQLETAGKQAGSLQTEIKKLDLTKAKLATDIKVTENKIEATNLTIQKLALQIGDKEEIIVNNKDAIASSLRQIDQLSSSSMLESMLAKGRISDVWNQVESLKDFQDGVRRRTEELKNAKRDLEDNKKETEAAKADLLGFKSELNDQKLIVDQNTRDKARLLSETKNQQANYTKLVADRQARKIALEKEIADFENQLKYILDPTTLPKSGVLSWPLEKIIITQQFGKTVDSKRLYASGTHNGVDFGTPTGTPVKAMSSGTVIGTGDTDQTCPGASFGKWVLVKYGNGLSSTFAHLSLIKVATGDKVTVGQVVGYSGNTGYSTGPHLHVSLYASGAVSVKQFPSKACGGRTYTMPVAATNGYLDPLYYLPAVR